MMGSWRNSSNPPTNNPSFPSQINPATSAATVPTDTIHRSPRICEPHQNSKISFVRQLKMMTLILSIFRFNHLIQVQAHIPFLNYVSSHNFSPEYKAFLAVLHVTFEPP